MEQLDESVGEEEERAREQSTLHGDQAVDLEARSERHNA
jgi:hypothetical protein